MLSNALSETSRIALDTNLSVAPTNLQTTLAADLNRILLPPTRYIAPQDPGLDSELTASPYVLRVAVLLLLTFCCYGVQVLAARERRITEEREEFLVRTAQLHSAGRLAAEVAHQIKNPLAIINNVTFSLHKSLKNQKTEAAAQVEIIREEIGKADRIITQIMGYAQLSEGRVEKIAVVEEINHAIAEVFPPGLPTQIKIHRQFDDYFPPVMMHRRHLAEAVGNLLQNARDAMGQHGNIFINARCLGDYSIEITVRDDGPGIPADRVEKVFEAYYTTRPKGTGLGLAVVKHNVELYGGKVRVESALGRGAKFILQFPARTLMKPGS
jgi:two-component system NtrC family sensor kinase